MSSAGAPVGPVDAVVIVFPGNEGNTQVTNALAEVIMAGTARLLDALIVSKSVDGTVEIVDIDEDGDAFAVLPVAGHHQGLLSEADARETGGLLDPGSTALIVAWENLWAVRLRSAIFDAGGWVVAHERIDPTLLADAFAGFEGDERIQS